MTVPEPFRSQLSQEAIARIETRLAARRAEKQVDGSYERYVEATLRAACRHAAFRGDDPPIKGRHLTSAIFPPGRGSPS